MNKSTPINQLPAMNNQGNFVNDQQRQMVMQAQSAVNALPMPQNTQVSSDMMNDDDATIQEVLNQINGGNGAQEADNGVMRQPVMTPQIMTQQVTPQMVVQPLMAQGPPQPTFDQYQQMNAFVGQFPPQPQPLVDPLQNSQDSSIVGFVSSIAEDIKFGAFIFILFIVVHFIPIDKFLMRYFALDKIPYYDIILKALVAFVAVVLLRKLLIRA
jgi:hypothetical protein